MKRLSLVLAVALMLAGGAYGRGWLDSEREKHPAVEAFEAFYWKLQKRDLAAASALAVPGSEAALALSKQRDGGEAGPANPGVARGFALDVSHEADGESSGRPAVRISGKATVTVDPAGYVSAFGVPELHGVEARMVEDGGCWRVAAFRDLHL